MTGQYGWGILLGILSGIMNAFGAVIQKSVVNQLTAEQRQTGTMKVLVHRPAWWLGLVLSIGIGTVFVLSAQKAIGPSLVPGLTASGMIVLAVASVRLIGEQLKPVEVAGILLIMVGIALLGWSRLVIPSEGVDLQEAGFLVRLGFFTLGLGVLWGLLYQLAYRFKHAPRGLILAFSGGFPFCISNLWILPMLLTIGPVFSGQADWLEGLLFVAACAILVVMNVLGVSQTQKAYCFAPASKVQPVQQIPTQIVPILIYFFVFGHSLPEARLVTVLAGVALILLGGAILGRREALVKAGGQEARES